MGSQGLRCSFVSAPVWNGPDGNGAGRNWGKENELPTRWNSWMLSRSDQPLNDISVWVRCAVASPVMATLGPKTGAKSNGKTKCGCDAIGSHSFLFRDQQRGCRKFLGPGRWDENEMKWKNKIGGKKSCSRTEQQKRAAVAQEIPWQLCGWDSNSFPFWPVLPPATINRFPLSDQFTRSWLLVI